MCVCVCCACEYAHKTLLVLKCAVYHTVHISLMSVYIQHHSPEQVTRSPIASSTQAATAGPFHWDMGRCLLSRKALQLSWCSGVSCWGRPISRLLSYPLCTPPPSTRREIVGIADTHGRQRRHCQCVYIRGYVQHGDKHSCTGCVL